MIAVTLVGTIIYIILMGTAGMVEFQNYKQDKESDLESLSNLIEQTDAARAEDAFEGGF